MAYVLGFFAADGYITVNKRGGQFWCIQINDKILLGEIKSVIKSNHKISVRLRRKKTENTSYRIQIGSIAMCNDLRKLGFSERKTKSLAIPNVPKKYFSDFVRGYFDGDGNVWSGLTHKESKSPSLTIQTVFTSCSLDFLEKLKDKLAIFGISPGRIREKDGYYRLVYSINNSLKLYEFMYNGCSKDSIALLRKKQVFEKFKNLRLQL